MNTDRIKEIQQETAYPKSVSVQQALLKVWNETAQEQLRIGAVNLNYMNEKSIVVWKDGSYKLVNSNESWEYENDEDWLTTITISSLTS